MHEMAPQPSFNFEAFSSTLDRLVEEYINARCDDVTFESNSEKAREIKEKKRREQEVYTKILDLCAEAIKQAKASEPVMKEIKEKIIWNYHEDKENNFGPKLSASQTSNLYEDLVIRLARM